MRFVSMFAGRIFVPLLIGALLLCGTVDAVSSEDVGSQGRVMPKSRPSRLAAPADQGAPVVKKLHAQAGDSLAKGQLVATLQAEGPAELLAEQAKAKVQAGREELANARATAAMAKLDSTLLVLEARYAVATAEAALAALEKSATRKRLPDEAVREIEVAIAGHAAALAQLREQRPLLVARLDAAVRVAQTQHHEASGAERRIAAETLAEARATRELSLAEYDARVAGLAAESASLDAKLAAARAANALTEREPAEAAAAKTQLALARERVTAQQVLAAESVTRHERAIALAAANLKEADAALRLAEVRLAMTRIHAPADGTVLRVFAQEGEVVGPNGVVEIADLSQMTVEAEVNVADIARVREGAAAEITVAGQKTIFTGNVRRLALYVSAGALADEAPTAFKDLRVVPVTIDLDAASCAALRGFTGAQVSVKIKSGTATPAPAAEPR